MKRTIKHSSKVHRRHSNHKKNVFKLRKYNTHKIMNGGLNPRNKPISTDELIQELLTHELQQFIKINIHSQEDSIFKYFFDIFKNMKISEIKLDKATADNVFNNITLKFNIFLNKPELYPELVKSFNLTYNFIIDQIDTIERFQVAPAVYYCAMRVQCYISFLTISNCIIILVVLFMLIYICDLKNNLDYKDVLKKPKLFNEFVKKEHKLYWWNKSSKTKLDSEFYFKSYIITLYLKLNKLFSFEIKLYEIANENLNSVTPVSDVFQNKCNTVTQEYLYKGYNSKIDSNYIHQIRYKFEYLLLLFVIIFDENDENTNYIEIARNYTKLH